MKKIAILFGGKSAEHEVSIKSAKSIYNNIDKDKYDISLFYMDKENNIFETDSLELNNLKETTFMKLKEYDLVFPVMHGSYGEDGKLQGLLEVLGVKYAGCNLLSSALCMDKVFTKKVLDTVGVPNSPYLYFTKGNFDLENVKEEVKEKLGYPCFIKPSNCGSSVGINKCKSEEDLERCINEALLYDNKVLIEKNIVGKEVEVAVLGNNDLVVSNIGEILSVDEFYTYDAKYNKDSITKIPADISIEVADKIKEYAKVAYKELECSVLSRIDFLVDEQDNIYLNEINTMPGFTNISMYPMLMGEVGISYSLLIDKIISLSLEK